MKPVKYCEYGSTLIFKNFLQNLQGANNSSEAICLFRITPFEYHDYFLPAVEILRNGLNLQHTFVESLQLY